MSQPIEYRKTFEFQVTVTLDSFIPLDSSTSAALAPVITVNLAKALSHTGPDGVITATVNVEPIPTRMDRVRKQLLAVENLLSQIQDLIK